MTDLITAEEAKKLLDGTTPGPWDWDTGDGTIYMADGDVSPRIATIDWDNTDADQGYADAELIAAAPDLARTVIALHAQPADARADRDSCSCKVETTCWMNNASRLMAERDRLAAANAVLEAKVAGLREAVDEQTKARAQHWLRRTMTAPEDAEVEALCERCGYGAVMDAASRLWARKPYGSGAFYIGGCIGFKSDEEARAALATQEAGT